MRVGFIVNANAETGYGHYHRCRALAYELVKLECQPIFIGDIQPDVPGVCWNSAFNEGVVQYWLNSFLVDWLVVDMPGETPDWVYSPKWKTCVIDGVGQPNTERADLIISHGLIGEYCAPKYVMLRPELKHVWLSSSPRCEWLVFGGGFDALNLCQRFTRAMPAVTAHLTASSFSAPVEHSKKHSVSFATANANIPVLYASGEKACLSMGMTVWEMLALGIPCWVFSKTERHLESAALMGQWINYWTELGLPEEDEAFAQFLSTPAKNSKNVVDFEGARRVAGLLRQC